MFDRHHCQSIDVRNLNPFVNSQGRGDEAKCVFGVEVRHYRGFKIKGKSWVWVENPGLDARYISRKAVNTMCVNATEIGEDERVGDNGCAVIWDAMGEKNGVDE